MKCMFIKKLKYVFLVIFFVHARLFGFWAEFLSAGVLFLRLLLFLPAGILFLGFLSIRILLFAKKGFLFWGESDVVGGKNDEFLFREDGWIGIFGYDLFIHQEVFYFFLREDGFSVGVLFCEVLVVGIRKDVEIQSVPVEDEGEFFFDGGGVFLEVEGEGFGFAFQFARGDLFDCVGGDFVGREKMDELLEGNLEGENFLRGGNFVVDGLLLGAGVGAHDL